MSNRYTLAVSHLDKFKSWLSANGWQIQDTKGYYEVLRAVKADRRNPLIIYKRETTLGGKQLVHLSVFDRDMGIVREFLKENKNGQAKRD